MDTDGKVSLQRVKEGQGWSRALETSVWHILAQHDKGIIQAIDSKNLATD